MMGIRHIRDAQAVWWRREHSQGPLLRHSDEGGDSVAWAKLAWALKLAIPCEAAASCLGEALRCRDPMFSMFLYKYRHPPHSPATSHIHCRSRSSPTTFCALMSGPSMPSTSSC
jgi:hypothetical protein